MSRPPRRAREAMPTVYTIAPTVSFVDALACGLLARAGDDPLALARTTVLLPTRRACRALQEAFLRASEGRALLLPRMMPLGDLDAEELMLAADEADPGAPGDLDLPPALPPLRRQLLLGRLVRHWGRVRGERPSEDQAVRLAAELARLLDQVETEGLSFAGLDTIVPEEHAEHWQLTLHFLRILTERWPEVQAEEGCIGPAARRRRLLEAQAEAWRRTPPAEPVVAAGSTGSIPATAALLGVVADLPQGMVVLPGLDTECDAATWREIADDPSHPQHGLALLLGRLGLGRERVRPWPEPGLPHQHAGGAARTRLVNAALAPAGATRGWGAFAAAADAASLGRALDGVRRIDCPGPGEEAAVIALVLRRALAEPGRRAALVTPDRDLARRVAAELGRWGVAVDDSAGVPLSDTPPGAFLRLVAEMVAGDLAPLPLLAALKHPLAAGGLAPGQFRARVRELERTVLRGPRPAAGLAGLRRALRAADGGRRLRAWLKDLDSRLAPFAKALRAGRTLSGLVEAHVACAEALAATAEEPGAARLWAGEAGAAAAEFVAELRAAAIGAPALRGEGYPALLSALLAGQVVRPHTGSHPRLAIWGPLEARLQHVDVLVLGGLNEGTWPAEVEPGPWLSRPMRAELGLPAPERRIGLAAHDFAQAFGAPRVYLTRASRVEGTPTVPSRWLLRLEALLQALDLGARLREEAGQWLGWAAALDRPRVPAQAGPPAPTPPLAARPRRLPVTAVEVWMRDPYDLYAREVLGLRHLDPIDADPGPAELGILVHKALERFLRAHPEALPEDPEAALVAIGRGVFEGAGARPGVWAFWWPRFCRIARWFARAERERRAEVVRARGEVPGTLELRAPGGPFTLVAKADRIDRLRDGGLAILDYKTGAVPTAKEVALGVSPQLPLEAAIAQAGGFADLPGAPVARLEYWRLTGGEPPGEIRALKADPGARAAEALAGLERLVAAFDDPATPYHATPRPRWARRYSDYGHLARIKEWASGAGPEDGA